MADEKFKIVVFGALGAGKSTLIQTIDPQAQHIEAESPGKGSTTTIAFDFGRVMLGGRRVYLYGTPGQNRFEFAREIVGKGMDGAILLVDVTAPVDELIDHLYTSLQGSGIPFIVLLNKCDEPGARTDEVSRYFTNATIRTVSALNKSDIRESLAAFIGTLRPHPEPKNQKPGMAGL
ncbi:MAG: GTP-binding protein [Methanoregula sp.]|nr:GTP-binding protein [Methanoregula sp.]